MAKMKTEPKKRKYRIKISRKAFADSRRPGGKAAHPDKLLPPNHTVRIWENVFQALKAIKDKEEAQQPIDAAPLCWSRFFIRKFNLKVKF